MISVGNLTFYSTDFLLSSGDSLGKTVDDHMRSTLTFNNKQSVFASQNIDYGQPIVRSHDKLKL